MLERRVRASHMSYSIRRSCSESGPAWSDVRSALGRARRRNGRPLVAWSPRTEDVPRDSERTNRGASRPKHTAQRLGRDPSARRTGAESRTGAPRRHQTADEKGRCSRTDVPTSSLMYLNHITADDIHAFARGRSWLTLQCCEYVSVGAYLTERNAFCALRASPVQHAERRGFHSSTYEFMRGGLHIPRR